MWYEKPSAFLVPTSLGLEVPNLLLDSELLLSGDINPEWNGSIPLDFSLPRRVTNTVNVPAENLIATVKRFTPH